jgi:flavorubredoxin
MKRREIKPGIDWAGAIDWDRRLFDSLIPLPDGTSYNAYLVRGSEKTALLDTVDPARTAELLEQLDDVERIDYVVIHHAEQDHSGSLPAILARYPDAVVFCHERCTDLLETHLRVPKEKIRSVEDGQTLPLGGRTLTFLHTPFVHWPETICTYVPEDRILFSCDFFGSHLATSELYGREAQVYPAAKRYFAEIMMPFRLPISKNLRKVEALALDVIAPSHGPLCGRPSFILDAYRDWVDGPPRNLVVLPYVTMHGSTLELVDRLTAALVERGVSVERFELTGVDIGALATAMVDAGTIVLGTPTVIGNPHPLAAFALLLANTLRPKVRFLSVVGSYGWNTGVPGVVVEMTKALKAEVIEPVIVKGLPTEEDLARVDALADAIASKHKEAGLV